MKTFAKALVAAAILAAPVAASADTIEGTMVVRLKGVNINTAAGAKTALKRIERAAERFCTEHVAGTKIRHVDASCRVQMVEKAVASVDHQTALYALYQSRQPVELAAVR